MKFMLLIHQNFTREEVAALPPEEQQKLCVAWGAINQTPGAPRARSSTTRRPRRRCACRTARR